MGEWEVDENGNLVKVGKADNGINPTTDLPWGVYPDKGSPTGYTHTDSGTSVYKDGSPWSGTTSDRVPSGGNTYNYNTTAANDLGANRYEIVVSDGNDGFPVGTRYQVDRLDNSVSNVKYPAATKGDNGINPTTDLPWDVYPDKASPSGYIYVKTGEPVYEDGSPYKGSNKAPAGNRTILIDKTGSVTGRAGTSYYYDANGTPHTLVTGSASSSSSGGSSSGGSSSGGSSSGGGSSSTGVRSGGYNNTNTTIREGGFTNTNINDIGPGQVAENAADRAQRASEFAATNVLNQSKEARDKAALYAQLLNTVDNNAYQEFIYKMGGGRLDNALLSGGNALSENALRPASMLYGGSSAGGGLTGSTGGGDPTSPGVGGGTVPAATPATPVDDDGRPIVPTTPTAGPTVLTPEQQAQHNQRIAEMQQAVANQRREPGYVNPNDTWAPKQGNTATQGDYGGNPVDLSRYYGLVEGIMRGKVAGTQSADPSRAGYVDERPGTVSPMTRANTPPLGNPNSLGLTGERGAAQEGLDAYRAGSKNIAPEWTAAYGPGAPQSLTNSSISGTGVATNPTAPLDPRRYGGGDPNAEYDPSTGTYYRKMAYGGMTRGAAIVGDPQANGRPNPEVIIPHDPRMTYDVVPLQDMPEMARMPMGGLSRYAYGTDDYRRRRSDDDGPVYQPKPVAAPVYQPAPTPAPVAPSPTAQTQTPPSQVGGYSTAPGSAGTPAPAPSFAPGPTPPPLPTLGVQQPTTVQSPIFRPPTGTEFPTIPRPISVTPPPPVPMSAPIGGGMTTYTPPFVPGTGGQIPVGTAGGTPVGPGVNLGAGGRPQVDAPAPERGPTVGAEFDDVLSTRLKATNPWMANPTEFQNVDYETRDPVARRNYEQWLTLRYGIPQESIDFAKARNRLGGASMASIGLGR